ncbi:MAG: hypothetical protein RL154_1442, partial [Pseudomonadota bacterium]
MLNINEVENISKAIFFSDLIRQDLSLWHNHIFLIQDAQNIHYLDASLASCCHKIRGYLVKNIESVDSDL